MSTTRASDSFRALGSDCRIAVWCPSEAGDPADLLDDAQQYIEDLEAKWSRFRPSSDVTRVNRHAGVAMPVSPATAELVSLAISCSGLTGGRFDPTVGAAVIAAGYDRSFDELAASPGVLPDAPPTIVPGCDGIVVDPASGTIRVPRGTLLDLGGIGKGRIADLVSAMLITAGASGVCVDLGGDVRVAGVAPDDGPWVVAIDDPMAPGTTLAELALASGPGLGGGTATSTTVRRRWATATGEAHHLIDPFTGRPSTSDVVAATVIAADTAIAEVFAKAALIAGPDEGARLVDEAGLGALLVVETPHGRDVRLAGSMGRHVVDAGSRHVTAVATSERTPA